MTLLIKRVQTAILDCEEKKLVFRRIMGLTWYLRDYEFLELFVNISKISIFLKFTVFCHKYQDEM